MKTFRSTARLAAGSILFAFVLYSILAIPGLVSDHASTVPGRTLQQARR